MEQLPQCLFRIDIAEQLRVERGGEELCRYHVPRTEVKVVPDCPGMTVPQCRQLLQRILLTGQRQQALPGLRCCDGGAEF